MNLEKFKRKAKPLVLKMAKLMTEAATDESIKKEPQTQHKLVSTALALLTEAETLEKELNEMSNLGSDNSISE